MKRYTNLWSKICDFENIKLAHKHARKDKSFYSAVKKTDNNLEPRLREIQEMLINHTYKPGIYRTSWRFDKGKWRILYKLPYHPDRVIQWAVMQIIEPCFQRVLLPSVCASLPNRGVHYTCLLIQKYMHADPLGTKYYLQIDIKKFYPNINRKILRKLLRKLFKDKELLWFFDELIDGFSNTDIQKLKLTPEQQALYCSSERGVPIGSYISQYFANFYLSYFDHWLKEEMKCNHILRYMDDIVIFSDNKEFLEQLVPRIKSYLQQELELEIKNDYVIDASINGIELLGYIHFPSYRLLSKVNIIRAKTLFQSIQAHQACTYHQWCSAISRIGWISWANSYNFMCQYFATISPILTLYYYTTHYACKHFDTNQIFLTNYKTHHQRRLKI